MRSIVQKAALLILIFVSSTLTASTLCDGELIAKSAIEQSLVKLQDLDRQIEQTDGMQKLLLIASYKDEFRKAKTFLDKEDLGSPQALEVLNVIRQKLVDPKQVFTEQEIRLLSQKPEWFEVYTTIKVAAAITAPLKDSFQTILRYWRSQGSAFHYQKGAPFSQNALSVLRDTGNGLLNAISPLEINLLPSPTRDIFKRQWLSGGKIILSQEEKATLSKFNALENYEKLNEFLLANPKWATFRRWIDHSADVAKIVGVVLAANALLMQSSDESRLCIDDFINNPKRRLADYEIQLINETTPFPHTALRIGNKIFSYGQTHLTSSNISMYLREEELRAMREQELNATAKIENQTPTDVGVFTTSGNLSMKGAYKVADLVGLTKLQRSLQVVTLSLTTQQVQRIKADLEASVGKRYQNQTFINDCTTMSLRAIERNTDFKFSRAYDASPSQVFLYFSALKAAGDKRVKSLQQVNTKCSENSKATLLRNTYINVIESKIFINMFMYNQAQRAYMESRYKNTNFQEFEPEAIEMMKGWKSDVQELLDADDQIQLLRLKTARIKLSSDPEKKKLLQEKISEEIDERIREAKRVVDTDTNEYKDRLLHQYKVEILTDLKKELLSQLQ